jgi:uncharacterized membrane protein YczE
MFRRDPWHAIVRRLPRLLLGLVLCGVGIATMVLANLGLGPWDVFHQGISRHTGVAIGTVGIITGFVLLPAWVPLSEKIGVGTLLNIVVIGVVIDGILAVFAAPSDPVVRFVLMAIGPILFGIGSGFYIGAGVGPGPRDGIMTGLAAKGRPVWLVRGAIELVVLLAGWLLGGSVGVGTVWFALGIGPIVHLALHLLRMDPIEPFTVVGAE